MKIYRIRPCLANLDTSIRPFWTSTASIGATASVLLAGALLLAPARSDAAEPSAGETAEASGEVKLDSGTKTSKRRRSDKPKSDRWIHKYAPVRNMGEIGIFGGVILPSTRLELFEPDQSLPDQGYQPLRRAAPEIGIRGGYYPLRFLGFELEGAVMPARVNAGNDPRATMWTIRGHVVGQLGLWSVTPFLLIGPGALGVASNRNALGNDVDATVHFGGGVKFYLHRLVQLRLDLRDIISAKRGVANGATHTGEILLGLSITLGRKTEQKAAPPPQGPKDTDGDGFLDDEDKCPADPGIAPDGCPRLDSDGDGFFDDEDKCPQEPGVAPDGCPRPDRDGDQIADVDDKCPDKPEVRNGYEDEDGCPDEIPKDVAPFSGVISGIEFDLNKDTIRRDSRKKLDEAVEVLKNHADIYVEIGGHTDSTGSREYNLDLSRRRARAVKEYLVKKGVAEGRITTRGYGPDKPMASNDTDEGRAKNRRIEFVISQQKQGAPK